MDSRAGGRWAPIGREGREGYGLGVVVMQRVGARGRWGFRSSGGREVMVFGELLDIEDLREEARDCLEGGREASGTGAPGGMAAAQAVIPP